MSVQDMRLCDTQTDIVYWLWQDLLAVTDTLISIPVTACKLADQGLIRVKQGCHGGGRPMLAMSGTYIMMPVIVHELQDQGSGSNKAFMAVAGPCWR